MAPPIGGANTSYVFLLRVMFSFLRLQMTETPSLTTCMYQLAAIETHLSHSPTSLSQCV